MTRAQYDYRASTHNSLSAGGFPKDVRIFIEHGHCLEMPEYRLEGVMDMDMCVCVCVCVWRGVA